MELWFMVYGPSYGTLVYGLWTKVWTSTCYGRCYSAYPYRYSYAGDDAPDNHYYPPHLNQLFHFGTDGTELPGGQQTEFPIMIIPAFNPLDAYIDAIY